MDKVPGQFLQQRCEAVGLTQAAPADCLGLKQAAVSAISSLTMTPDDTGSCPPDEPPTEKQRGVLPGSLVQVMVMPVWLLRSPDFHALRRRSPLALRVLLCLWAHGRGVGSLCFPGERRLAALCETSVPSISLAIKLLELGQWIVVQRQRARGQGNRYTLRLPDDLAPLHARAESWLARPATGQDAPPVEDLLLTGDLWGRAGKGRRRFRQVRVEAAAMNSDAWDALWRENALAGHLWLLLQAYRPSGEQTSLSRLARELGARTAAVSVALRRLRHHGLLQTSIPGACGTRHTVALPAPDPVLHLPGALPRPGCDRQRRACPRGSDGRWQPQGKNRPRRSLIRPVVRVQKAPATPPPAPVVVLARWCLTHKEIHLLSGDLRYGGELGCGCIWTPTDDQVADTRRPTGYRSA